MSYNLNDLRVAAYNWTELPDMTLEDRYLWMGLGYCYEWYRCHPEDKQACDELAQGYIDHWKKEKQRNDS